MRYLVRQSFEEVFVDMRCLSMSAYNLQKCVSFVVFVIAWRIALMYT